MEDGANELTPRRRNVTPARTPFTLPPRLQEMLDRGRGELAKPFTGVTTDGTVVPGLFRLENTGLSLRPVVEAATAFLAGLEPAQRQTVSFPLDSPAWQSWSNVHPFMMRHGICIEALDDGGASRAGTAQGEPERRRLSRPPAT